MCKWLRSALILIVILGAMGPADRSVGAGGRERFDPNAHPSLVKRKPFLRWWWAYHQRSYPLESIPRDAPGRAHREIEKQKRGRLSIQSAPIGGDRWVGIGPAPLRDGSVGAPPSGRPMSSRASDIAVHPSQPSHWLIGTAQGGVWRTLDAGETWAPLTDAVESLTVGAVAFAPGDPNVIYVGTGETVWYAGVGLLKSVDGGVTWTLVSETTPTFDNTSISDIRVDPTDPDTLVVSTTRGIAGRGLDLYDPPTLYPPRGIFRSTDGGVTWTNTLAVDDATDLDVDPANFSRQLAGAGNPFGSGTNGLYRSTDGGATWSPVAGPWDAAGGAVGRIEIAIAPSNPNVAYLGVQDALVEPPDKLETFGQHGGLLGLWKTTNAWDPTPAWTSIPVSATDDGTGRYGYCGWDPVVSFGSSLCWYAHELSVDPSNANVLYAGGIPLWRYNGSSWTEVSQVVSNPAGGIHRDQHAMAWSGGRLIVANDGGIWSTTNGGATWNDHNATLSTMQFYDGVLHPTDPMIVIAGAQDNGTQRWNGAPDWSEIGGGDGADNAISSSDPGNDWAISSQFLNIGRTVNGGLSFTAADVGIDKTGAPFIARMEKCPSNDNVFIAGTDNLWRTANFFTALIYPAWTANGAEMGVPISALAFAPSDPSCNTYAFAAEDGELRITTNGGASWADLDPLGGVPGRYVADLAFDPTNADVLYVALSGFDEGTAGFPGHLFKSGNARSASPSWSNLSPPVNLPMNAVAIDPFDPSILYVGSDLGLWKSITGGASWTHHGPSVGMPNVPVFDIAVNHVSGRVVAFTHGRGAFVLADDDTPPDPVGDLTVSSVTDNSVTLSWTSPGDDGAIGTAASYDLRYHAGTVLGAGQWAGATRITGEPAPKAPGSAETVTITGLACNQTFVFALRAADEVPNVSELSNSVSTTLDPCPDFSLTPASASVAVAAGGETTQVYTITSIDGFAQTISFSASGLPNGVSANFVPSSLTPPANGATTSTLTFSATLTAACGGADVTVRGSGGGLAHTAAVALSVTGCGLVGDLDGSGRVDGFDLARLARSYNSAPDDPAWDPQADLDGDGAVNADDLQILIEFFGRTQ